ncbi:hypothetical protein [Pseudoflavonifractor capillosus]|uniref:DUF4179 domain-containing protein n=1 Tax=Pseudoflavonifractor capillosus TaxID=106588 RepID=A0A921MLV4_9FIRM|nr:hypothetical protein [Pseudoflavonifractor capillosus]HJG86923.1 hypothetical protein [Pseudoflavonifractor capillosus]
MSSMERLWKDMELSGPCPEINPAHIRRRVNAALNADPSERSIYMRQKIRMAAVMAAIALTGTALAVGTNWDALMEHLGLFAPYVQTVDGVSATDQGLKVSVVAALSDESGTRAYVAVTDLTGDRLGENLVYNGRLGSSCISYDQSTRTALLEMPMMTERDFNEDGSLTLTFASFQPGFRELTGIPFPEAALSTAARSSRLFTDGELTKKVVNHGTEARALLPDQNPVKLEGTDLIWISSSGFDENGVFHILYEMAEGVQCVTDPTPFMDVDGQETGSYRINQLSYEGGRYLDVSFPDSDVFTRESVPRLKPGDMGIALYTGESIEGSWELTFFPENLPQRSAAMSETLSGMSMTGVDLTAISLRLELTSRGGTPANYPVSVYLADGTRIDIEDWGQISDLDERMTRIVKDGRVYYGTVVTPPGKERHFAVTWYLPVPIDPEQVTGFSLGYRMYALQDGAAVPTGWLTALPGEEK